MNSRDRNWGERRTHSDRRQILLVGDMEKKDRQTLREKREKEREEGEQTQGRDSSKERKSQAEQGKIDVYLSQQTKTREDTQGVI